MRSQGEFGLSYRLVAAGGAADRRARAGDARARASPPPSWRSRSACRWASTPALYRNSWLSRVFLTFSLIGVSLPTFLIGILLILLRGAGWAGCRRFGRGDTVKLGWWSTGFLTSSGLQALILPSITLGLFQLT